MRNMIEKWIPCKPVTFGGPTNRGGKYWTFKNEIKKKLKSMRGHFTANTDVHVSFSVCILRDRLKRGNDLDNFAKPIIDAIDKAEVIASEKQIAIINMKRELIDPPAKEGVKIMIRRKQQ